MRSNQRAPPGQGPSGPPGTLRQTWRDFEGNLGMNEGGKPWKELWEELAPALPVPLGGSAARSTPIYASVLRAEAALLRGQPRLVHLFKL
ncbi:hypothetical protein BRAS3809_1110005 [Bradyrhizobium sp. STM 3809]|nr:hypothetical protein BRAS3809_1110005 [Bradyrhizobium sp. STM 3809]